MGYGFTAENEKESYYYNENYNKPELNGKNYALEKKEIPSHHLSSVLNKYFNIVN